MNQNLLQAAMHAVKQRLAEDKVATAALQMYSRDEIKLVSRKFVFMLWRIPV